MTARARLLRRAQRPVVWLRATLRDRSPSSETGADAVSDVEPMLRLMWPSAALTFRRSPALGIGGLTYALLPRRSSPTMLLPTRPREVLSTVLAERSSSSRRRDRFKRALMSTAGRMGAGVLLPGTVHIGETEPGSTGCRTTLMAHLEDELGQELVAGISVGPPRANRKPVLHLLDRAGNTVAFAKVGTNDLTRDRVRHEAESLALLGGVSFEHLRVPAMLGAGMWHDCSYLVLSPVPTQSEPAAPNVRAAAMRELVQSFDTSESRLSELAWWAEGYELLGGGRSGDDELADLPADVPILRDHTEHLESACGDRMLLAGAAHGDWAPWNMATSADAAIVWDWERFATSVPVGWDALHFAFQSRVRLRGMSPRDALRDVAASSHDLAAENGARQDDGPLLLALYALRLGARFVADWQGKDGSKRAPLSHWLLPELGRLIDRAEDGGVAA